MLKRRIEKLEDVSEGLRGEYTERDGAFFLQVDGDDDTSGLKNALQSERLARKTAKKDLEEARSDLVELREEFDRNKSTGESKGADEDIDALKSAHQLEMKSARDKLDALQTGLENEFRDNELTRAVLHEKGEPALLLDYLRKHCKVNTDQGQRSLQILNDRGEVEISRVSGDTGPMSVSEFVKGLRESDTYGKAFSGSEASGSGATRAGGTGGAYNGDPETLSEKVAFISKHGYAKWQSHIATQVEKTASKRASDLIMSNKP